MRFTFLLEVMTGLGFRWRKVLVRLSAIVLVCLVSEREREEDEEDEEEDEDEVFAVV